MPPAPPCLHELLIDVCTIGSYHIGKCAPLLIFPVALNGHILGIDESGCRMSRAVAERLAFLRAINTTQANPFFFPIPKYVDGISIEDSNHFAGEGECVCSAVEAEPGQESDESHEL